MIIMTILFENIPGTCCYPFIYLFFSQYNIIYSIFHQGFAYHSETPIIIGEREREKMVCVCVCVCVYVRERERKRENSEAFTSYFFFDINC